MTIDDLMEPTTTSVYYLDGFRAVLEDHMTILRTHVNTTTVSLTGSSDLVMDSYRYEYDFFGLLDKQGVPKYMHWIVMRMMDMTSPTDFDSSITYYLLPDESYLSQLAMAYRTTNKLS